jgi:hypothetical protein
MLTTRKVLLGALLTLPVAAVLCGRAALDGACGNDPIAEAVSPDGELKALAFQRNCGATTGFSTQISVVPAEASAPSGPGNVFIADANHGAAAGPGGGPKVDLAWASPRRLVITHDPSARVFKAEAERAGASITYATSP